MLLSILAVSGSIQLDVVLPRPLTVRICAQTEVDDATLQSAAIVAERLLSEAGATTTWRVCQRKDPPPEADDVAPDVVAILSSGRLETGRDQCGFADRRPPAVGTALVSVRCVEEFTKRIARQSAHRWHPHLASGRYDDFLGVLLAHEIGHLLGLAHAREGVMRARLDADDIVAFRSGRLQFTPKEMARLRAASAQVRSTLAQRER